MPIYTNKYNYPQDVVNACTKNTYTGSLDPNVYSVTTLLNDPKEIILLRRHYDEIVVDISKMIWALIGTAVHHVMELANTPAEIINLRNKFDHFFINKLSKHRGNEKQLFADLYKQIENDILLAQDIDYHKYQMVEKRLYGDFLGKRISGQADNVKLFNRSIMDYKVTTAWQYTHLYDFSESNTLEKYKLQINSLAWLLEKNGYGSIDRGEILMIFRDWSKYQLMQDYTNRYPDLNAKVVQIEILPKSYIENYWTDKLSKIIEYEKLPDDEIPPCSPTARWQKGVTYKAYKIGNKTPVPNSVSKDRAKTVSIMNDRINADVARDYKKQTELKKNADMTIEQKLELDKNLKKLYKKSYEIIEVEDKPRKCLEYCDARHFCSFYKSLPDEWKE